MLFFIGFILVMGGVGTIETVPGTEGMVYGTAIALCGVLCMVLQTFTDGD